MLEIEHLGSHGPAWVFLTAEGKALMLVGQWLYEQRKFPAMSFRLHQWAETGAPIRVEVPGRRRAKPEHSVVQLQRHYRFKDVEVFDATADTLQADLEKAFAKGA